MDEGDRRAVFHLSLIIENPYCTLTDKDGRFKITDVLSGTYKMVVWHPYIGGVKELAVTIQPKKQTKADMKIPAPTGRLYATRWWNTPMPGIGHG